MVEWQGYYGDGHYVISVHFFAVLGPFVFFINVGLVKYFTLLHSLLIQATWASQTERLNNFHVAKNVSVSAGSLFYSHYL